MVRTLILSITLLILTSCGSLPLSALNPFQKGPSLNANVLAGAENTQQLVAQQNQQDAGRDIITNEIAKEVEAESVEEVQINNTNIPPWVILLLLLGWLLPTPQQIGQSVGNFILRLTGRGDK